MKMGQKKPDCLIGMDHRTSVHGGSLRHTIFQIFPELPCHLPHIMQQSCQIACFLQPDARKIFRGELCRIPAMFLHRLNVERAVGIPTKMRQISHPVSSLSSDPILSHKSGIRMPLNEKSLQPFTVILARPAHSARSCNNPSQPIKCRDLFEIRFHLLHRLGRRNDLQRIPERKTPGVKGRA